MSLSGAFFSVVGRKPAAQIRTSPYREVKGQTTWIKVKNPEYSQAERRQELFNKRRRTSQEGELILPRDFEHQVKDRTMIHNEVLDEETTTNVLSGV